MRFGQVQRFILAKKTFGVRGTLRGFRATLKKSQNKVALNPLDIIFLNFADSFILPF